MLSAFLLSCILVDGSHRSTSGHCGVPPAYSYHINMWRQTRLFIIVASICFVSSFVIQPADKKSHSTKVLAMTSSPIFSSSTDARLKHIESIREIVDSYNIFLLDMWGVMHDGSKPYQGVIDTVKELKKRNKKLVILSNSSKRRDNAVKMLTKLGFDPLTTFDDIITSGDISYRMLSGQDSSWDVLAKLKREHKTKVFVIGSGDDDEEYCVSSGWSLSSILDADLIIARGTFTLNNGSGNTISKQGDGEQTFDDVLKTTLAIAAQRKLPMLITNPDKVRPDKELSPMPGAIGDAYEKLLGTQDKWLVKRIGKPYQEVYDLALRNQDGSTMDPSKAIMVGDALETDVTGASQKNCASLWVLRDGIHAQFVNDDIQKDAQSVLDTFNRKNREEQKAALVPTFVIPHFRW